MPVGRGREDPAVRDQVGVRLVVCKMTKTRRIRTGSHSPFNGRALFLDIELWIFCSRVSGVVP